MMWKNSKNQCKLNLMWWWQKNLHNEQETGNTLVIAMSLGLLLIGATITAIVSSTHNKTNITAIEASVQALEIAELGVTRTYNFLAQNPQFALAPLPSDQKWDSSNAPLPVTSIPQGSYQNTGTKQTCSNVLAIAENQNTINQANNNKTFSFAQNIDKNNSPKGSFRLLDYLLKEPDGKTIATSPDIINNNQTFAEGSVIGFGQLTLSSNVFNPDSFSQVKVTIPLRKRKLDQIPFPSVWLSNQDTDSAESSLDADLMVSNCDNVKLNLQPGRKVIISSMTFPQLPAIPAGIPDLGNITETIYLPRVDSSGIVTDTPDSGGIYHYAVSSVDLNANEDFKIIPGYKVNLYLKSIIKPWQNSSSLIHQCSNMTVNGKLYDCDPANPENATSDGRTGYHHFNLKIFGYGHSGTPHATVNPIDGTFGTNHTFTSPNSPSICLRGNGEVMAFIFAPEYLVEVTETGGTDGFQGALWVKKWGSAGTIADCTSDSSQVTVVQTSNTWSDVGLEPQNIPPIIDNISKWQREAVN